MVAFAPFESDELLESDEFYESDESDESDEARSRRRFRSPVRTAKRGGAVPQRPQSGFATKAELQATANRLDGRIATNSTAIKTLEGRVNTLSTDVTKMRTDAGKTSGSLNDVRNMSMLTPLLTTQTTRVATADANGVKAGDKIVVDTGDNFSRMLPLLMFSGAFGSSSGGGQSSSGGMFGGGDSGGIMMLALVMAMSNK